MADGHELNMICYDMLSHALLYVFDYFLFLVCFFSDYFNLFLVVHFGLNIFLNLKIPELAITASSIPQQGDICWGLPPVSSPRASLWTAVPACPYLWGWWLLLLFLWLSQEWMQINLVFSLCSQKATACFHVDYESLGMTVCAALRKLTRFWAQLQGDISDSLERQKSAEEWESMDLESGLIWA